jgi:hypothetical protein
LLYPEAKWWKPPEKPVLVSCRGFVGAMTDNSYEAPVRLSGTVIYVSPDHEKDQQSERKSPPKRRLPDIAIIKTGSIFVVLWETSSPTPN